MQQSDSIEYHISEHYLSAIINKDYSGLTDTEEHQIEDFEYQVMCDTPIGFEFGHFDAPSDYSEDFGNCEICNMESKIVPLIAIYWKK
jgi:hypothetical protein